MYRIRSVMYRAKHVSFRLRNASYRARNVSFRRRNFHLYKKRIVSSKAYENRVKRVQGIRMFYVNFTSRFVTDNKCSFEKQTKWPADFISTNALENTIMINIR